MCVMQYFVLSKETGECRIRMPEVQEMNPEQEWQAQAKRVEDSMRQFDEDLRYLNWRIAQLETMIRRALEQANTVDVSTPWHIMTHWHA